MGKVVEVNGPLVTIELADVRTGEQVRIGRLNLSGEVIARHGARALVQVYEPTESLRPGEPVEALGHPLSVELGPGLLGGIFDGVQRPLLEHAKQHGDFIPRGVHIPPLDRSRLWRFEPATDLATGTRIESGAVLGSVQETAVHRAPHPGAARHGRRAGGNDRSERYHGGHRRGARPHRTWRHRGTQAVPPLAGAHPAPLPAARRCGGAAAHRAAHPRHLLPAGEGRQARRCPVRSARARPWCSSRSRAGPTPTS